MNLGAPIRERDDGINYAIQPPATFPGASIAAAKAGDGLWRVTDRAGKHRKAVGFDVHPGATAGNLLVHLVEDFTSAGVPAYHTVVIPAVASTAPMIRQGFLFDYVDVDNSTVDLANITILL